MVCGCRLECRREFLIIIFFSRLGGGRCKSARWVCGCRLECGPGFISPSRPGRHLGGRVVLLIWRRWPLRSGPALLHSLWRGPAFIFTLSLSLQAISSAIFPEASSGLLCQSSTAGMFFQAFTPSPILVPGPLAALSQRGFAGRAWLPTSPRGAGSAKAATAARLLRSLPPLRSLSLFPAAVSLTCT